MAKNNGTVYLGFEDEEITEKYKSQLNYTVNKVGGVPDWPTSDIKVPYCPICNCSRPLLVQIYAPLENSSFHRTLYIFACLNTLCSIKSRGWICIRTQTLDKQELEITNLGKKSNKTSSLNITWCDGADDWGDNVLNTCEKMQEIKEDGGEENGNIINNNMTVDNSNRISDDDESTENEILNSISNLNVDDKNANCGAQGGVGSIYNNEIPTYAEIEGEESEIVTIESPVVPQRDLIALMKQTTGLPAKLKNFTLKSFFIYVEEEKLNLSNNYFGITDHVRELIQDYQLKDEISFSESPSFNVNVCDSAKDACASGGFENESYEKAIPAHGDIMFHNFMSTIQENSGQIIRYTRDSLPLLIAPLTENVPKCQYCGGECICEIQILPSLIPLLKFQNNEHTPIEYGNVLIFTCLKSCWDTPDKMRIENVIVQQEA
ncbi:programmed cell death protein 2-like [Condylostylus longicornis]|uniref:programmed cell death protein 2-like n=1 Tax=Condylostylus longicornis TaxID=2530218 RepID=UPI00244DC7F0|nr:programmed cell death protein 2-like [Condylostylus longicornis]